MNRGFLKQLPERLALRFVQFLLLGVIIGASSLAFSKPLIFLPFQAGSDWYVVQGQHGSFSHKNNQEYAYDLTAASGSTFGTPLYSPVNGRIVEIRDGVEDWENNSSSNHSNHYGWGNTIVIEAEDEDGVMIYVRLAHLKYQSTDHLCTKATDGPSCDDTIKQGDYVGKIGQTGYSTNPHLHIQVQYSTRGNSVDFDFVEAHPRQGDVVTSRLKSNLWVIDNFGRINAGAPLGATRTGIYKTWTYYTRAYYSVDTYATADDRYARYYWHFGLPSGGRYDLYASCPAYNSRTSRAQYYFYGNGMSESSYVNQRYYSASGNVGLEDLHYVDTVFPSSSGDYHLRVRNTESSGRLCADAIFIHKR